MSPTDTEAARTPLTTHTHMGGHAHGCWARETALFSASQSPQSSHQKQTLGLLGASCSAEDDSTIPFGCGHIRMQMPLPMDTAKPSPDMVFGRMYDTLIDQAEENEKLRLELLESQVFLILLLVLTAYWEPSYSTLKPCLHHGTKSNRYLPTT